MLMKLVCPIYETQNRSYKRVAFAHFDYSDYAIEQNAILTNSDFIGSIKCFFKYFSEHYVLSKQLKKLKQVYIKVFIVK